jgi:pilus assembly protein FimV
MGCIGSAGAAQQEEIVIVSALQRMVVAVLCLLPSVLWALGVGGIEVSSGLNQRFDARIPIVGAKRGELADASARLADDDVFARAGLARSDALRTLKFAVVATGDESGYIHITSRDHIREPALEFIVQLKWRNGSLQRKYGVLLEPK